jgi:uncharacterized membrane protein
MRRRADHTGLLVAAAGSPYTFQRTLTTRSNLDQAIVSGLSFVLQQTTASTVQESIQALARIAVGAPTSEAAVRRWSRATLAANVATLAVGMVVQKALQQRPGESLGRAGVRSSGWIVSVTSFGGAVIGAVDEASAVKRGGLPRHDALATTVAAGLLAGFREFDRRRAERLDRDQDLEPTEISALRALAMSAGVAVGATVAGRAEGALADRIARTAAGILPGDTAIWRPVGHAASIAAIGAGGRSLVHQLFHRIEGMETSFEPAVDVAPLETTSSGGPDSLVPFSTLARMGRRFVWTVRRPDEIERVIGRPATNHPIRVYVGLTTADTEEERVDRAVAELERTGAFDRPWLMVVSPTGTGYVNYAAAGALEFLTAGDCAIVAMQYSARPSPLSIDRVAEGRSQIRRLLEAIHQRLAERETRPRVVLFGESLGAWTSQDAFIHQGTKGLDDLGIDKAIWIGTPFGSEWKEQVLGDDRPDVDRSLVGVFNDIGEWQALGDEERDAIRFVMITHHNDGVAVFGPDLLVQSPEWLGAPEERPVDIPRGQRWIPITTFVQTLVDMKNAARVVPGQFAADGHDYRADLVPFLDAALGFDVGPEMIAAMTTALEAEETRRVNWIAANKAVGGGMAVAILDRIREQHPEALRAALDSLGADIRRTGGALDAG